MLRHACPVKISSLRDTYRRGTRLHCRVTRAFCVARQMNHTWNVPCLLKNWHAHHRLARQIAAVCASER